MSWEANQPQAVMQRARDERHRARNAATNPNSGAIKLKTGLSEQWKRPVVKADPPEVFLNRQELLLVEIRDAIRELTSVLTKRGKGKR